jgi:hypothetical protein
MSIRVSGILEINWSVELPEGKEHSGAISDDPVIEAVLDFIPQTGSIYLWGEDEKPVDVFLEVHEEDMEIEEDERG